jgi:RND family efflux transporter MFP subunit
MSFSMVLGRVLLPLAGLGVATALAWHYGIGPIELPPGLTALSASAPPAADDHDPASSADRGPARPAEPAATIVAEGRVVAYPGTQVIVGAEVTGTVVRVAVVEKSPVRRGDLLVEFRSGELRAQVAEAAAKLAEAEADVGRLEVDHLRAEALLARQATPRQEFDQTRFNLLAQRARRDAMAAAHDRLVAQLARYRVVAPIDGVVTARQAQPGETVAAAAPLVTITDLTRIRIEAEVDEYDIASCRVGSPVKITAEGYPDRSWRGAVEEVADVLVGRRIRPEDPGKPTDTRVLPVRIAFREATPLRLGQRVEVEIDRAGDDAPPSATRPTLTPPYGAEPPGAARAGSGATAASPSAARSVQ